MKRDHEKKKTARLRSLKRKLSRKPPSQVVTFTCALKIERYVRKNTRQVEESGYQMILVTGRNTLRVILEWQVWRFCIILKHLTLRVQSYQTRVVLQECILQINMQHFNIKINYPGLLAVSGFSLHLSRFPRESMYPHRCVIMITGERTFRCLGGESADADNFLLYKNHPMSFLRK